MAVNKFKKPDAPFKWKYVQGEIILCLVRWHGRYALSYAAKKQHKNASNLAVFEQFYALAN